LNQQGFAHFTGPRFPLVFEPKFLPITICENIKNPKPDIVAGIQVFVTRISEANNAFKAHDREGNECLKNRQRKTPEPNSTGRFEMTW
jgi:hypothetical protein